MITYYIVLIFINIFLAITAPLLVLPIATISIDATTALSNVSQWLAYLNVIFPINELLTMIGIIISMELAYFGYKGIRWIYRKIPGIN